MNSIIVFSPSNHTLLVSKQINEICKNEGVDVSFIDITKKDEFLFDKDRKINLIKAMGTFDLLFLGAPIYAGHMESNLLNLVDILPLPDKSHSPLVCLFATYGGAHTIIALEEIGFKLKKRGYINIVAMKIAAIHVLTISMSHVILPDRPGQEEEVLIRKATLKALDIGKNKTTDAIDITRKYIEKPIPVRLLFHFLSQDRLHKKYKKVSIIQDNCICCKTCIEVCPVNNFIYKDGKVSILENSGRCILCGNCFRSCPVNAINFSYQEKARERLKDGKIKLSDPLSEIYY